MRYTTNGRLMSHKLAILKLGMISERHIFYLKYFIVCMSSEISDIIKNPIVTVEGDK